MIVPVTGLPGAGKSTLARASRDETGLPLFSLDTVKEAVVYGLGASASSDRYAVRLAATPVHGLAAEARRRDPELSDSNRCSIPDVPSAA